MTGQGGGLPLSKTSFGSRPSAPLSSCGQPPFPFSGLLEVHNKGPVCLASSPTGTSSQFRVSTAIDHQPGALLSARGQQQERAPKGRDPFHVGKGGHRESGEQVLTRVLQPVVCNPPKNGKLRLVIDLRLLNHHLRKEKFHLETPAIPHHSIQKGDWVISLDLTDAYLHISIHPSLRKFLRFCYQDEVFQFRVLPFGLSVSPRVFTRVVDAIMAHVRSLGLEVHHYLDDWLLRSQQLDHLRTQTQGLLHLTTRLGWIPSLEKSELSPTQDFVFIGTHY